MEPFTLATGIAGLLSLAIQASQMTQQYCTSAKHATKAALEMVNELKVLESNLSHLRAFLESESGFSKSFEYTSVLYTSTNACRIKIEKLCSRLNTVQRSRFGALVWPFSEEEYRSAIQDIRGFAQTFQFALTTDGCILLSKTSRDVKDVLENQLKTMQQLEALTSYFSTQSIDMSKEAIQVSQILNIVVSIYETKQELSTISEDIRRIEQESKEKSEKHHRYFMTAEREAILRWISADQHEKKHHDICSRRLDNTGQWLLESYEFQNWRDNPTSPNIARYHGFPGVGKSVLASLVIDHLSIRFAGMKVAIAYFYFDYRDRDQQSPEIVVATLLRQLLSYDPSLPKLITDLYRKYQNQQKRAPLEELEGVFRDLCKAFQSVYVVIDALDECDEKRYRRRFLQFLTSMRSYASSSIRFLVTSRPHIADISTTFSSEIPIMLEANDSDVRKYLEKRIEVDGDPEIIDETFRKTIVEVVVKGAQGMFLLPALQIQFILDQPTVGEMEHALTDKPKDLEETYKEVLNRIQQQSDSRARLGMRTLMWLSHARRPLSVGALAEALAIRTGDNSLNRKLCPLQKTIIGCCMGLATVDDESSTIRLVHYSVQEYLRQWRDEIFPQGEETIAELCLTYLLFNTFGDGCSKDYSQLARRLKANPFLSYAAYYWGCHVRESRSENGRNLGLRFLQLRPHWECMSQVLQFEDGLREEYWEPEEIESFNELHVTSFFGLCEETQHIIDSKAVDVDAATKIGTTPLIRAASWGHIELVRLLLKNGGDLKKRNWYGSVLHCVAEAGKEEVMAELLEQVEDVDDRDSFGRTSLHCAVGNGHLVVARQLLEKGAKIDAVDDDGATTLHFAVDSGNAVLVRELLRGGADINAKTNAGETILAWAIASGHGDRLQGLLQTVADSDGSAGAKRTLLTCLP